MIGTPIAAAEIGSIGEYLATIPNDLPAGKYLIVAMAGTEKLGSDVLYWNGDKEITPELLDDIHKIKGLDKNNPMTVTQSAQVAGNINVILSGDGETQTVVTRQ